MNPSFRFLRQVPSVTRRISVSQKSGIHHHQQPFGLLKQQSFFSTQPEKAICYEDLVKETLKKMVAERVMESSTTKEIADLDLERRFQHYDCLLQEAESCIHDLREATPEHKDEEFVCASGAVDTVFEAYIDLLDDLRMANEEQLKAYQEKRETNAKKFMNLRKEIGEIMSSSTCVETH